MAEIINKSTVFGVYDSDAILPLPEGNFPFAFFIQLAEREVNTVWWVPTDSRPSKSMVEDLSNFTDVSIIPATEMPGYVILSFGAIENPVKKAEVRIEIFALVK